MSNRERRPLERITLTGYKSIRELKRFRLERGLNVLIGANGSGKTNFIRFFELLGHMMDPNKGLQNYLSSRGRADAFLFRGMKVTPEFSAHLKFGLNEYKFTMRAASDRSLFFAQESAPFDGPIYGHIENDQGTGHTESALTRKSFPNKSELWVVETIRDWRVYHFHDTSPSAPVMGLSNIVDNDVLHGDASNIAAFLLRMAKTHPEHFAQIEETVRQVAPFFGSFVLKEVAQGQTQLLWKDRYSDLLYYPYQLSDGTIRFICLATLLLQPEPASTLIIDEPELGLHPFAIKLLASLLHDAARRAQLIVSTQSSHLLDELTPEQVIVVNQQDGASVLEHLDPDKLKEWLEEYTLGQLWEKNELGGQP
ncbi:MAG: AAA family ATPase [Trichloromonas sp.]|jgi:predicted ATPase|nr:AAA family ATPase [Trichloromonas sp.]